MTNEQTDELIEAVRRLSTGRTTGRDSQPTGLEALTMAVGGQGFPGKDDSVARGLHDIADAIREYMIAAHGEA